MSTTNTDKDKDEALRIIKTYQCNRVLQQKFKSLGNYIAYVEHPESSPFKVITEHGNTKVIANRNVVLSSEDAHTIVSNWENNPDIRAEFSSLNIYRAYVEATLAGKTKIIGSNANRVF